MGFSDKIPEKRVLFITTTSPIRWVAKSDMLLVFYREAGRSGATLLMIRKRRVSATGGSRVLLPFSVVKEVLAFMRTPENQILRRGALSTALKMKELIEPYPTHWRSRVSVKYVTDEYQHFAGRPVIKRCRIHERHHYVGLVPEGYDFFLQFFFLQW